MNNYCSQCVSYHLVSQPFGSVREIDHSAVGKSSLFYEAAHYPVVAVGVDAEVAADRKGIFNDPSEHAVALGGAGDAVDDVVG